MLLGPRFHARQRRHGSWRHQQPASHRLVKAVSVLPDVRRTQHGKLKIHVKRARNLVAMDTNGFSDPYAIVKVHSKKSFRTSMIKALNPDWDQFVEYHGSWTPSCARR